MAFSALPAGTQTAYLSQRPGPNPGSGTLGIALVSDLVAGDYLWGMRASVVSTGATSGNPQVRALTLERRGVQFNVSLVAASSLWVVRSA